MQPEPAMRPEPEPEPELRPCSWAGIAAYAADQAAERSAGRGPHRKPEVEAQYNVYKQAIAAQGLDNHGFVVKNARWQQLGDTAAKAALEPNLVPYFVDPATHWVLWHHPDDLPGDTELEPAAELALVQRLLGDSCAPRDEEVILFQNIPAQRSIPTIAHSHVFIRPLDDEHGHRLARRLDQEYSAWRARSPVGGSSEVVSHTEPGPEPEPELQPPTGAEAAATRRLAGSPTEYTQMSRAEALEVLGLSAGADLEEIEKATKKQARRNRRRPDQIASISSAAVALNCEWCLPQIRVEVASDEWATIPTPVSSKHTCANVSGAASFTLSAAV